MLIWALLLESVAIDQNLDDHNQYFVERAETVAVVTSRLSRHHESCLL